MDYDKDWKKTVGFTINYDSQQSSEDDFDSSDVVVMRRHRHSDLLLEDGGDGAEADLMGTTPPRQKIRNARTRKENVRQRIYRMPAAVDDMVTETSNSSETERLRRRISQKMIRSKQRDIKLDQNKADSLPSSTPAVATLVESCSRFMSLSSRLKCRKAFPTPEEAEPSYREELPASRVNFHQTFSMLINMGNIEKGCRRTISREEQVWQNELKDLIWLELQAKIAGRTLAQQDAFLCAQRNIVPTIVQNIRNYRFVNPSPCRSRSSRLCVIQGSREDLTTDQSEESEDVENNVEEDMVPGCISFNCQKCVDAIGKAMREVSTLLDSFYNATTLYPSSKAMTQEHPHIATNLFKNRVKAMCLWYNTALHMRLTMLAVRRMLRTMRMRQRARPLNHFASTDSEFSRQSSESKPCQVRFNVDVSATPSDSTNSDSSGTDHACERDGESAADKEEGDDNVDSSKSPRVGDDTVDASHQNGAATPEIVISDSKYETSDTVTSNESGYSTSLDHDVIKGCDDVFNVGSLEEMAQLRLLDKCSVSPYRNYHNEMLKTQGVRRCMTFMAKMRLSVLHKVYLTLEKPDRITADAELMDDDSVEVFDDTKEDENKTESDQDEEANRAKELRRYGCWSEESVAMRLPSYRNHFLLLSSISMEAVHDYLALRLEGRPLNPSCLTVKQLIHELKEGLDIATEMRAGFVRNIEVALVGHRANDAAKQDLLLLIRTFDATVETVLKQYLSYLTTMSEVEHMPRASLQAEWAFTARLAKRTKCAAQLAPLTFSEIACNQISRLLNQFDSNFKELTGHEYDQSSDPDKHIIYALCRSAQGIFAREREATLQAAQWARALAARLARAPPPAFRAQRADIFNSLMSMRDWIVCHTRMILERSSALADVPREYDVIGARVRELLLQIYRMGFEIHKELHRFVDDPSRAPPSNPRRSVTSSPPKGRPRFLRSESIPLGEEEGINVFEKLFENISDGQSQSSIELLLAGETRQPQPEEVELRSPAESISDEEKQWATRVARAVVEFARCWMQFVVERCDTGRGLRPRWASQGLEFLMLACDPNNTKHLSDSEFEKLKKEMDSCISHVVGSRPAAPRAADGAVSPSPARRPKIPSPLPGHGTALFKEVPSPPAPPTEPDQLLSFHGIEPAEHNRQVQEAIKQLDESRDEKLREMKTVGRVLEAAVTSYEPKLRQLKFKWQRGLKIGAGTFGKVYTVVNTESGQLLAMKELSIGVGDRRALQRAANELRVLEGVIHPHLVRYYGCELHREEMLLFMELCVEGSLEALVATSGALAEHTARRYTKQLLSAVLELHARGIAHRDIKSGNIFLTNEGHCLKLGDFGCAVKIRANTTAAGELQGCVGTQAYMAPEVFMKSSGHGRAADIWSLGCVVTEMASGKRPFSEYDSNYQIMFVVGMGGRPRIPDTLSEEGRDFCLSCLTHEPDHRPRAEVLSLHHFLMVKSDDDCHCEPGFLRP